MTTEEVHKLKEQLAQAGAEQGIKAYAARILKAIQSAHLTFPKLLRIYAVLEKAAKEVEAIVKEK